MLVQARSLRKDFSRGSGTVAAVEGADLSIAVGDFISLTGSSGSGKTTLLAMLAGVLTPTDGAVLFEGTDIPALSDKELSAFRNREIGFIPQGVGILKNFTVLDNVRMPQAFAKGAGAPCGRAAFLLEAVGLGHLADACPLSLSGGEMRRIAIARALFTNPRLVVADEPTNDLDPENAQVVMRLLEKIAGQGAAVILATHEEKTAARGSRRFVMRQGRLEELSD